MNSGKLELVKSFTGPETPALLTRMSIGPISFEIVLNIFVIDVSSEISTPGNILIFPRLPALMTMFSNSDCVSSNGSFLLPSKIILAPFSANFFAIAWPIPVPLPVTNTTLLANLKSLSNCESILIGIT